MAMFGFAGNDRTVDQARLEDEGMMNLVARNDEPYRGDDFEPCHIIDEPVNTDSTPRKPDETESTT